MGTDAATTPVSTYRYDPNGLRILKTTADTETLYTYGVDGILLEETRMFLADPGQNVRLDFVHAYGTILAWQERTGTITRRYWAITDHLGSVSGASDESGTLVMRQDYDAFGNPHEALLPGLTGPRFTGKDWDEDTELYYFNARWYDPDLGRFITEDPIRDGVNWYGYVNNRPLNLVDPSGLEPKSDPGFISDIGNANYTDIYLKQKQLESIEKERWEARIRKDEAHKRAGGKDLINGRGGKIAPPTGDYLDDRPSGPHEGIDIILGTADDKWHTAPGTPVYSEDNGVVIDCTKKSGAPGGYTIWIKSDQNALAPEEDLFYIHVAPLSILSKGDHIVRGELIGYISGEYNWHLHFQIGEKHKTKSPYLFFEKIGKEDE